MFQPRWHELQEDSGLNRGEKSCQIICDKMQGDKEPINLNTNKNWILN